MNLDDLTQIGRKLSFLIPQSIENWLIRNTQQIVFCRALKEFCRSSNFLELDNQLIDRLIYGWGNQGFSAKSEFIKLFIEYTSNARGPILECGTGLSTILVGIIAQKTGNRVYSFEHDNYWYEKVKRILKKFKINSVNIFVNQLKNYGEFDWYDPIEGTLPGNFNLVICDGPPASTLGGRYGLIPVMKDRLIDSLILLDDYSRVEEQNIVKKWQNELNLSIYQLGKNGTHVILKIS